MRRFIFILTMFFAFCLSSQAQNNLLNLIDERLPNGNFKNDDLPIMQLKTNAQFTVSPIVSEGKLWRGVSIDTRLVTLPRTNYVETLIVKTPLHYDLDKTANWKIGHIVLGNDNKWHLLYRNVSEVEYDRLRGIAQFKSHYIITALAIDMWGYPVSIYRKPVENGRVFKACLLLDDMMVSEFVYSQRAAKFFTTWNSNEFDNDVMSDEFKIDVE